MSKHIDLEIRQGDILTFQADVVALKYAQAYYGADKAVERALSGGRFNSVRSLSPRQGEYGYIDTEGKIGASHALFVGVVSIEKFRYEHVRDFSARVMEILTKEAPEVRHLALTVHGPDTGLDETEALLAQVAGILDALQTGRIPAFLTKISIVEINAARSKRLEQVLEQRFADAGTRIEPTGEKVFSLPMSVNGVAQPPVDDSNKAIKRVGTTSEDKPHAFVAMPFNKDMDDLFYFGIQQPIHAAGLLCERIDQAHYTGYIVDQIKKRIESATVVVAVLTGANPNVYLEVGYSWGKGRPTILVVNDSKELLFDLSSEKCLVYDSIKNLAEILSKALGAYKQPTYI